MVTNTERPGSKVTLPYKTIIYEKKPPIAYITLNRPEKLNAIDELMRQEWRDALGDAGWADKSIKVIVMKGAGRCFSAGWDLADAFPTMEGMDPVQKIWWGGKYVNQCLWEVMWDNPKPIIIQVHGFCFAAGMGVVSLSDLCICSEDALFGYPNVRSGGPYLAPISPYILGMKKAKELMFTGNTIDAQEAWRLGLVNKVVPRDKLEEEVDKMARTISKVANIVNECSKKAINMVYELQNIKMANERGDELEMFPILCSAENNPEYAEYMRIYNESGLKAALDWRNGRYAEEDAWWKERKVRSK